MQFDVVTLVYSKDISLLRLQARSTQKYLQRDSINRIIIIANDPDNESVVKAVRETVIPEFGDLADKVQLITGEDLGMPEDMDKYLTQQMLKLYVAKIIETETYLVLDAKNHFLRPLSFSDFVNQDGKPVTHLRVKYGHFVNRVKNSFEFFGIEEPPTETMPTTTPFVMLRDTVLEMIEHIEASKPEGFIRYFEKTHDQYTEFFLYQAYVAKKFGSYEAAYDPKPNNCVTLFTRWPDDEHVLTHEMQKTDWKITYMFGLHSARIPHLSAELRKQIIEMWESKELISPGEDVSWVLPEPESA